MAAKQIPLFDDAILDLIDQQAYPGFGPASWAAPMPGKDSIPAAQAYIIDGASDALSGDVLIDVCFFADTYRGAREPSRSFDAVLMGYPLVVSSGGSTVLFDSVESLSIPKEVPWVDDLSIRRFLATYRVTYRR